MASPPFVDRLEDARSALQRAQLQYLYASEQAIQWLLNESSNHPILAEFVREEMFRRCPGLPCAMRGDAALQPGAGTPLISVEPCTDVNTQSLASSQLATREELMPAAIEMRLLQNLLMSVQAEAQEEPTSLFALLSDIKSQEIQRKCDHIQLSREHAQSSADTHYVGDTSIDPTWKVREFDTKANEPESNLCHDGPDNGPTAKYKSLFQLQATNRDDQLMPSPSRDAREAEPR
jgi:hypothetical protein